MSKYRVYQTSRGVVAEYDGEYFDVPTTIDELLNVADPLATLEAPCATGKGNPELANAAQRPLAPIGSQEVWACGVTYYRSRVARMEESSNAGGGDFYDRVYEAERPELFFKATPGRVVGPGTAMHLRSDSRWIVPEPELALAVSASGRIVGYTIGNDLSCRDIEGENPLYLPQAKTFDRCAALGPCLLVTAEPPAGDTAIRLVIRRGNEIVAADETTLGQMKRSLASLVEFLYRDNTHPHGSFLMTGTGIVPDDALCLERGDVVDITIDGIGTLSNPMD